MKKSLLMFLGILPNTLLTVLIAVTAALRFYEPTDFPPQFPPGTFRDWSLWAFAATLLVALVDLGLKWFNGNLARNREDQARDQANQARNREIEREQRQIERKQYQDRRDFALLTYLAEPTPENQQKLTAICQEIQQNMDD
ncbi:hypothetical protein RIF25_01965 [Thermosynechococcaceae cyanobacterium BACA0444]|uniref:Uncharacterized protein n=1 Tax=Pseudocalidococcus azoricus BACA0444 TaxID=2918990 RepID=A0AAE4FP75_9CYAN|nr:hypothetical protein [Pseudocalidococcus azoricus]MDS3859565.1 hypothetical protein [Pseudocalidococcus azoricus BACA0444]